MNFAESTEEIAPLTEEEKKARLEELRQKMAEKRAKQAIIDKEEQKKNEVYLPFSTLASKKLTPPPPNTENSHEVHQRSPRH
jgi:hypothetical protein